MWAVSKVGRISNYLKTSSPSDAPAGSDAPPSVSTHACTSSSSRPPIPPPNPPNAGAVAGGPTCNFSGANGRRIPRPRTTAFHSPPPPPSSRAGAVSQPSPAGAPFSLPAPPLKPGRRSLLRLRTSCRCALRAQRRAERGTGPRPAKARVLPEPKPEFAPCEFVR